MPQSPGYLVEPKDMGNLGPFLKPKLLKLKLQTILNLEKSHLFFVLMSFVSSKPNKIFDETIQRKHYLYLKKENVL